MAQGAAGTTHGLPRRRRAAALCFDVADGGEGRVGLVQGPPVLTGYTERYHFSIHKYNIMCKIFKKIYIYICIFIDLNM